MPVPAISCIQLQASEARNYNASRKFRRPFPHRRNGPARGRVLSDDRRILPGVGEPSRPSCLKP